jgi:pyruvate dehydrogenase E2 component (dihydrolipoamide acetyltransferase)
MPKFGLTMTEGTIQKWFKSEGEAIKAGEAIFEVETEKVLYEVECTATGTVAKLLYPIEAVVAVGLPVAVIAEAGENVAEVAARYGGGAPATRTAAATSVAAAPSVASAATSTLAVASASGRREGSPVTPAARKLAQENNVDVSQIVGTGPGGRITREDVEKAIADRAKAPTPAPVPAAAAAPADTPTSRPVGVPAAVGQSIPLRGMRKVIAERMHKSLQGSAQLTITTEVDVTQLIDRRQEVQREFNATYTDFIVQACAHALKQHPRMNSTLDGETIRHLEQINVGIAVALEEGLIVPVVSNTDKKSLRDIAQEARALAEKARAGKLTLEEVSGGTFTVSNLGMFGVDGFTPIINAPQIGILGVGRIVEKPVIYRGEIAKRSMMVLSLTFDHRIIDGAPAGAFLQTVADLLAHGNRISLG